MARTRPGLYRMRAFQNRVTRFCDTIRATKNWVLKILDKGAIEWALEHGGLEAESDSEYGVKDGQFDDILAAIEALQVDAHRIRAIDHGIHVESKHLPQRTVDFDGIGVDVRNALKYARGSKYAIRAPALRENVGVFVSDGVVPVSLHRELTAELNALSQQWPKDFHFGSNGKVQTLINPSLYPYVADVTPVHESSKAPSLHDGKFKTRMANGRDFHFQSPYSWVPSIFRVSDDGTDVHIQSYINGLGPRERFPVLYRLIENVFMLALPHFERTLDFHYAYQDSPSVARWIDRAHLREGCTQVEWVTFLARQQEEKLKQQAENKVTEDELLVEMQRESGNCSHFYGLHDFAVVSAYKGQNLKVIVKVTDYILQPGEEYEENWHMEGLPHEHIVASVVYCYDTDPAISDDGLGLRRYRHRHCDFPDTSRVCLQTFRVNIKESHMAEEGNEGSTYEDERANDENEMIEDDYPSDWEGYRGRAGSRPKPATFVPGTITLGKVPSNSPTIPRGHATGQMLSLPNWIQHRVLLLKNCASADKPQTPDHVAKKRTISFFLVKDDDLDSDQLDYPGFSYKGLANLSVLTTMDVPPQECRCNAATVSFLISVACQRLTGRYMPPELTTYVTEIMDFGMTRDMAEQHLSVVIRDQVCWGGSYLGVSLYHWNLTLVNNVC